MLLRNASFSTSQFPSQYSSNSLNYAHVRYVYCAISRIAPFISRASLSSFLFAVYAVSYCLDEVGIFEVLHLSVLQGLAGGICVRCMFRDLRGSLSGGRVCVLSSNIVARAHRRSVTKRTCVSLLKIICGISRLVAGERKERKTSRTNELAWCLECWSCLSVHSASLCSSGFAISLSRINSFRVCFGPSPHALQVRRGCWGLCWRRGFDLWF